MGRLRPRYIWVQYRQWLRSGPSALLLAALLVGAAAGLATSIQGAIAHWLQMLLYGVGLNRLSALTSVHHPAKLLFLPLGALLMGLSYRLRRRRHAPVDIVEANALHGGLIPLRDTLTVCGQTIVSNGFGASVGLEAAYAQAGGGIASLAGKWLRLRREDMRVLVGAGAGAAVGAAFNAPLTGAFYCFEVVIGAYTPAAIAPVAAAALSAALLSRAIGTVPFLVVTAGTEQVTTSDYLLFALLGVVAAIAGIAIMWLQTVMERGFVRLGVQQPWRTVTGGLLLIPIVWLSPQALSSGHGALRMEIAMQPAMGLLAFVFMMKSLATSLSISCGFRGGLFFASLFLGSLLGPIYAQLLALAAGHPLVGELDAALVGMAALATSIVGAPMTLSLLVLETTHDFSVTGAVIAASLCASAFTRANFGYSFSTWRLHLRGTGVRSARDVGWVKTLTAQRLMRREPATVPDSITIGGFRARVPLGSATRVLLRGPDGAYRGIVGTARAYDPQCDLAAPIGSIAELPDDALAPGTDIAEILDLFEQLGTEELAVVDGQRKILGVVTEKYVQRRYIEESEKSQSRLFGE